MRRQNLNAETHIAEKRQIVPSGKQNHEQWLCNLTHHTPILLFVVFYCPLNVLSNVFIHSVSIATSTSSGNTNLSCIALNTMTTMTTITNDYITNDLQHK